MNLLKSGLLRSFEDGIKDKEAASFAHRLVAAAQDVEALLVAPIVDDLTEDVDVASLGHGLEEAASDNLAAWRDRCVQGDVGDHLRQVEQHPGQAGDCSPVPR